MPKITTFADESGNFDFSRARGASRYFILTLVTLKDHEPIALDLQRLRHQIAWEGHDHPGPFHAQADPNPVKERVFEVIGRHDLRVDALILEKSKSRPHLRATDERFYQHAWYFLMKYVVPRIVGQQDELLVVAASIGKKKKREAFYGGVRDVLVQVAPRIRWEAACWSASADPCLQVADYCGWAIQRRWERGEDKHYSQIEAKIHSEFDVFAIGTRHYY